MTTQITQATLDEFHRASEAEQNAFLVAVDNLRASGTCSLIPFTNTRWLTKFGYFTAPDRKVWAEEILKKLTTPQATVNCFHCLTSDEHMHLTWAQMSDVCKHCETLHEITISDPQAEDTEIDTVLADYLDEQQLYSELRRGM